MAHDLVTELLQYSSLACFMAIWQLCANLLIPNCLRSNLSYSPLAALELYVKKANSYFGGVGNIVFLTEKHSSPDKKIYIVRNFPILTVPPKSYSSYSSYSSDSSELTP